MATKAEKQAALEKGIDEAKLIKGIQFVPVFASVDPTAYVRFKVREDLVAHFEIKPVPSSIGETDKLFIAKKKSVVTTTSSPVTATSSEAGSITTGSSKLIGRAIKIPAVAVPRTSRAAVR